MRKRNAEKHAAYQSEWRKRNPNKVRAIRLKVYEKISSDPVRKAARSNRQVLNHNKRNESHGEKPRRWARWQDWEVQAIFDTTRSALEIGNAIGRSLRAVERARVRYRDRAPMEYILKFKEAT